MSNLESDETVILMRGCNTEERSREEMKIEVGIVRIYIGYFSMLLSSKVVVLSVIYRVLKLGSFWQTLNPSMSL